MRKVGVARLVSALLALAVAGAGLSGCNTVRGVGQDIQSTGQAIERTSY